MHQKCKAYYVWDNALMQLNSVENPFIYTLDMLGSVVQESSPVNVFTLTCIVVLQSLIKSRI